MTTIEINTFIETMEEVGDIWTPEQVKDIYGDYSLQDALKERQASLSEFMDNICKILT